MAEPIFGEDDVPIIDCSTSQIFRCTRCKAYINPNFIFVDNGHTAICNLCKMNIKVPAEYYSSLNEFRQRNDKYLRPE